MNPPIFQKTPHDAQQFPLVITCLCLLFHEILTYATPSLRFFPCLHTLSYSLNFCLSSELRALGT